MSWSRRDIQRVILHRGSVRPGLDQLGPRPSQVTAFIKFRGRKKKDKMIEARENREAVNAARAGYGIPPVGKTTAIEKVLKLHKRSRRAVTLAGQQPVLVAEPVSTWTRERVLKWIDAGRLTPRDACMLLEIDGRQFAEWMVELGRWNPLYSEATRRGEQARIRGLGDAQLRIEAPGAAGAEWKRRYREAIRLTVDPLPHYTSVTSAWGRLPGRDTTSRTKKGRGG